MERRWLGFNDSSQQTAPAETLRHIGHRQHPAVSDRRYGVGVALSGSVNDRREALTRGRGGARNDLPTRADLRREAPDAVHAKCAARYRRGFVLRLEHHSITAIGRQIDRQRAILNLEKTDARVAIQSP